MQQPLDPCHQRVITTLEGVRTGALPLADLEKRVPTSGGDVAQVVKTMRSQGLIVLSTPELAPTTLVSIPPRALESFEQYMSR